MADFAREWERWRLAGKWLPIIAARRGGRQRSLTFHFALPLLIFHASLNTWPNDLFPP
jgi:hypothetical protein